MWFAWKIVLLQYRKQHWVFVQASGRGCDLLEKSYFCSIANNTFGLVVPLVWVVICLKNRTFAVSQTTRVQVNRQYRQLWFAWKIVLLQYRKQPNGTGEGCDFCCDLLEKSYFCSIANNCWVLDLCDAKVVICLKNRTFAVSQTTALRQLPLGRQLWFAWKIVLLQYRKQHYRMIGHRGSGCDLLEKSYFCSIANNGKRKYQNATLVVICLKNRTFAVSQTTTTDVFGVQTLLWFAWKIVLLQYRKQLKRHIYLYYKQIQRFKK